MLSFLLWFSMFSTSYSSHQNSCICICAKIYLADDTLASKGKNKWKNEKQKPPNGYRKRNIASNKKSSSLWSPRYTLSIQFNDNDNDNNNKMNGNQRVGEIKIEWKKNFSTKRNGTE